MGRDEFLLTLTPGAFDRC